MTDFIHFCPTFSRIISSLFVDVRFVGVNVSERISNTSVFAIKKFLSEISLLLNSIDLRKEKDKKKHKMYNKQFRATL